MMRYNFPHITNLSQVEEAIKGRDEFIIAEREFGYVVNYLVNFEDTFPRLNTKDEALNELYALRRECRGIKFDKDGKLIARTLHKFFNMNERAETEMQNVDFSDPFVILDKLDGSMIHPIRYKDQVALCTKMGLTDYSAQAQTFIDGHSSIQYNDFCWKMMMLGYTPTFEWLSRKNRIVIDHPVDQLVLIAIREMYTGSYREHDVMVLDAAPYNVPVVKKWQGDYDGIAEFVEHTRGLEDTEGYVIRFDDGHMLKQKADHYVALHKIKALLDYEKDVWALILDEKQDDLKSMMEDDDKARIDAFAEDLYKAINELAERLNWVVIAAKDNLNDSKKRFALEVVPTHHDLEKGLLFKIWDGADAVDVVKTYVRNNVGTSTKVDMIRSLLGDIKWERY